MEMTIDEIIKYLPAPICGSTVIDSEKQKEYEAYDTAVIIMRKYQKIIDAMFMNDMVENIYFAIEEILKDDLEQDERFGK